MKDGEADDLSSSSSPKRRSLTPLPVSTGPDNEKYSFSPSSSLSPPVSPPSSSYTSAESLYMMHPYKLSTSKSVSAPSSFSVDQIQTMGDSYPQSTSCLKELLEWFLLRCCVFCSWNLNPPSKPHQR